MTSKYSAKFRRIALLWLPPIMVSALRRLCSPRPIAVPQMETVVVAAPVADTPSPVFDNAEVPLSEPPEWEMVADTDEIWAAPGGWAHDSILRTQLDRWPDLVRSAEGPKALGQSHGTAAGSGAAADYATHNTIMSYGYALGRVAERRKSASVLDWGGGLGPYYVYARALFPDLKLDYVIKDFQGFCDAGGALLPEVTYVSDEAEALSRSYDFVFASSSLPYTRDFYGLVGRLCDSASEWLMITRTPMLEEHEDFVVVQRPHRYGYMTEYAGWFINRRRLVEFVVARGFRLERQFLVAEEPNVPNAPERALACGLLFQRTTAARTSS